MSIFGGKSVGNSYSEEKKRLAAERAAKIAKRKSERKAEGAERVRNQQAGRTVLTNPLGLGGDFQQLG